jgi:hypothetical protein
MRKNTNQIFYQFEFRTISKKIKKINIQNKAFRSNSTYSEEIAGLDLESNLEEYDQFCK